MIYQDILDTAALKQYASALNARAKRAQAKGRLTADGLRDRILASGGRCEWCAASLVGAEFELDHVLSLHQGGANRPVNLVVACPDCNRRKGQKHPARFAAEIYLETGRKTDLLVRVLQRHGIEPAQQNSLFCQEARESAGHIDAPVDGTGAPPYSWADWA